MQSQQQRADNGKPYTVAIHRLNNKTLNDSLLMEVEDTTNYFSRRTSVGDLKNYIGSNLSDTAFKRNIDTIPRLLQSDLYLVVDNTGETRKVSQSTVKNSALLYFFCEVDSSGSKGIILDSLITTDDNGDTLTVYVEYDGVGAFYYEFQTLAGGEPTLAGTTVTGIDYNIIVTTFTGVPGSTMPIINTYATPCECYDGGGWFGSIYVGNTQNPAYGTREVIRILFNIRLSYL